MVPRITVQELMLLIAIVLVSLALGSCDDMGIHGGYDAISINIDGSMPRYSDGRLYGDTYLYPYLRDYGSPHYYSEDVVFYLGSRLSRKGLEGGLSWLTPDSLDLEYNVHLNINPKTSKLYFSANGDLYECGFMGENLRNLTQDLPNTLINPSMSEDCTRLIAVSVDPAHPYYGGDIVSCDIATMNCTEIPLITNADYAWYNSEQDRYYFFSYNKLYSLNQGQEPVIIYQMGAKPHSYSFSHDKRFFCVLESDYTLKYIDCQSNEVKDLGNCTAYAFLPQQNGLIVSKKMYDMSDLRLYDPATGEYELIFDGIIGNDYQYWTHGINPRWDGKHLFFRGIFETKRSYNG